MILVYGGSGFLGKNIIDDFSGTHDVLSFSSNEIIDFKRNKTYSRSKLDQVISHYNERLAYLFVASMRYNPDFYRENPIDVYTKNMHAFFGFVELLRDYTPKRAVLTSSFAVYGSDDRKFTEVETLSSQELSFGEYYYALAKMHQEQLFTETCERLNIDYSIARIPGLYGLNSTTTLNNAHVLPSLIMKAISKGRGKIPAFGTGSEKREFLFVSDLVNVLKVLINKPAGILNISNNQFTSIRDLATRIEKYMDNKVSYVFKNTENTSDINHRIVCNEKFLHLFPDFEFTALDAGLIRTIEWYKKHFRG